MLPDMLDRTKIIYKGDVLAGSFYLLVGFLSLLFAIGIRLYSEKLGFYYLSVTLFLLCVYMVGKGIVMIYMYGIRYRFYNNKKDIGEQEVLEEVKYTEFRIAKKHKNRRLYMYIILIGCFVAFIGLFHQEKGLIIGTCIPIVLLSAIEFSVGLLTEFRLSEYFKQLNR